MLVEQAFQNDGLIVAQSGGAVVARNFVHALGKIEIMAGGAVELCASGQNVIDFVGSGGLLIEDQLSFGDEFLGFAKGDTIHLRALGFEQAHSSWSFTPYVAADPAIGGNLKFSGFDGSGGPETATLSLPGNYTKARFTLSADTHVVGDGNFGTILSIS